MTFSAWLAAATVGVLGGGSYFAHYLIELVPVSCVAAAVVLARAPLPIRLAVLGAVLCVALPTAREGAASTSRTTRCGSRRWPSPATSASTPARATPTTSCTRGPTSSTTPACGTPTRTCGASWSEPSPARVEELQRLLGSSRRPTWLVQWQDADDWELDPDGRMDRLLSRGYRLAAVVCGHPIFLRNDRRAARR